MPTAGDLHYFAFGANMCSEVLVERRGVRPLSSEAAELRDHRLVFEEPGLWLVGEPAFASIRRVLGDTTWGVLHHLRRGDFARLDQFEGPEYELVKVSVCGRNSGAVEAFAYRTTKPVFGRPPSTRYLRLLCAGAREHDLPPEYIARLEAQRSVHFPVAPLMPHVARAYERVRDLIPWRFTRRRGFPRED